MAEIDDSDAQLASTIGAMSSGQSSVGNNSNGQYEVYRGSKAALNMLMRRFAARHRHDTRTLLLMAPGWVQTDMGGRGAPDHRRKHSEAA